MHTPSKPPAPGRSRDQRSGAVVSALLTHGLLDASREAEARVVVDDVLAGQRPDATPLRRRFAEVAGYVGGAFVVAAAALFFSSQWGDLSLGERLALLAGIAVLLAVAGGVLVVSAGGRRALRGHGEAVRCRLASVLFTGAALSAAFAVSLQVDRLASGADSEPVLAGAVTALVLMVAGYLLAPTALGQLGAATAAFVLVPSGLDLVGDVAPVPFGLLVLLLGLVWLGLAERRTWRERDAGQVIGCVLVVLGAQIPVFGDHEWVGYLATVAVGVGAFGGYVVRRAWPYLVTGVVAVTLAVPEALTDWTQGSLGSAGVLLVTGITLLVAALAGLRLRKEVGSPRPGVAGPATPLQGGRE